MLIRLLLIFFCAIQRKTIRSLLDNSPFEDNSSTKEHVENYLKDLPDQFSYDELEKLFVRTEANTTNNDMGMENHFYTREIQKDLKKMGRVSKKLQLPQVL